MGNLAEKLPELNKAEETEDFEVIIQVRSVKYNCHMAYNMTTHELYNNSFLPTVTSMKQRLKKFTEGK